MVVPPGLNRGRRVNRLEDGVLDLDLASVVEHERVLPRREVSGPAEVEQHHAAEAGGGVGFVGVGEVERDDRAIHVVERGKAVADASHAGAGGGYAGAEVVGVELDVVGVVLERGGEVGTEERAVVVVDGVVDDATVAGVAGHRAADGEADGLDRAGAVGGVNREGLGHDLAADEAEGVRGLSDPARRALPDEEDLSAHLVHLDHRCSEPAQVGQLRKKRGEGVPDLAEPDVLPLDPRPGIVDVEDRGLGVVLEDAVEVLAGERGKVVVPPGLNRGRRGNRCPVMLGVHRRARDGEDCAEHLDEVLKHLPRFFGGKRREKTTRMRKPPPPPDPIALPHMAALSVRGPSSMALILGTRPAASGSCLGNFIFRC